MFVEAADGLDASGASSRVVDYLRDPARVREAVAVAPLAQAFARYEIEPVEAPGIGRYAGRLAVTPALGVLFDKQIAGLDRQALGELEQLVLQTVARGYRTLVNMEGSVDDVEFQPRTEPPLQELWAFWVTHLYDQDLVSWAGIDDQIANETRAEARQAFTSGLRRLGLFPRLKGRTRVSVLGMVYGQAGMVLRLAQCASVIPDDRLSEDLLAQMTNLWPLDAALNRA